MQERRNETANALLGSGLFSEGSSFDIFRLIRALLRRVWAIVMVGVIFAAAGYFFAKATYVESYIVNSTLQFTTTKYIKVADENGKEELVTVVVAYENSNNDSFKYLLKTDIMINQLYEATGKKYGPEQIRNAIAVTETDVKDFFGLQVTGTDPEFCRVLMDAIIDVFPDYLRSQSSTLGISLVNYPTAPAILTALSLLLIVGAVG